MKQNAPKSVPVISDCGTWRANRKKASRITNSDSYKIRYSAFTEFRFVQDSVFRFVQDSVF